jgi:hypothetical protein
MDDDEKTVNPGDEKDEPVIVGAAVCAAGQRLEDIVSAMDIETRKGVALIKGWPAEVVLASLKMERAHKKSDTEGECFWHEVRDYVMQRGCVVAGTPVNLFYDWHKWRTEPWRRYGLRLEWGWLRKAGVRRLTVPWRVYEEARNLREEGLGSAAMSLAAMKRKAAQAEGDRESMRFWDKVCSCLSVSPEEIVAVRDKPGAGLPFRLEGE